MPEGNARPGATAGKSARRGALAHRVPERAKKAARRLGIGGAVPCRLLPSHARWRLVITHPPAVRPPPDRARTR